VARIAGRTYSRLDVTRAAWRVIVRDGLHNTTVRAIAKELGATTGVVMYYFRDKDELMLFALDRLGQGIQDEARRAVEGATGIDRVLRLLTATLPLGPRQEAGWRIWIGFVGHAMASPRLRDEHRRRLEILSELVTKELRSLKQAGILKPGLNPRKEADALIAMSDGIGLGHMLRPELYPPARQWEIVRRFLEHLVVGGTEIPRRHDGTTARRQDGKTAG